jgi:hypothetical protein
MGWLQNICVTDAFQVRATLRDRGVSVPMQSLQIACVKLGYIPRQRIGTERAAIKSVYFKGTLFVLLANFTINLSCAVARAN